MLPKCERIRDRNAIKAARRDFCEYCYRWGKGEVHHIKSKGAGGHDVPDNLIHLCHECHRKVHDGKIPRRVLREIVGKRTT